MLAFRLGLHQVTLFWFNNLIALKMFKQQIPRPERFAAVSASTLHPCAFAVPLRYLRYACKPEFLKNVVADMTAEARGQ